MRYFVNTSTNDLIYRIGDTVYPFLLSKHSEVCGEQFIMQYAKGGNVACIPPEVVDGLKEVTEEELEALL